MYHQLHNGGLVTIEDISYISEIEYCNFLMSEYNSGFKFYYTIYFRSGAILVKEIKICRKDDKVYNQNNPYLKEDLDKQDCRNCSFYRNFEKDYNLLIEKYKEYQTNAKTK